MKKLVTLLVVILSLSILFVSTSVQAQTDEDSACWGQASAVFARMGEMGEHSSSFDTPRYGLANLARLLLGEDATIQDLGAVVAADLGLTIEACM